MMKWEKFTEMEEKNISLLVKCKMNACVIKPSAL